MLRSYIGLLLRTWKKWLPCCSVSWRRSFHHPSSIQCSICFYICLTRQEWEGLCSSVDAIQLKDARRFFERNVRINAKLRLRLLRHIFWRCQTSRLNTMVRSFPACIIHNAGDNESSLSIFRGQLGSASDARYKTLNHEEWRRIMLYLLTNLSEVEPYIG